MVERFKREGRVVAMADEGVTLLKGDLTGIVRELRLSQATTGGIAWNKNLREELFSASAQQHSLAPKSNTGHGVDIGVRAGAGLDDKLDSAGLWMPCSILERPAGPTSIYPHIILDRSQPGLIAVNKAGR